MSYRTIVKPKIFEFNISHQSNLLLIGSCFSENIGDKLVASKFNTLVNPFGILFNPISIGDTLLSIMDEKEYEFSDLIQENGLYHSFSHHGKFSGVTAEEVLVRVNESRSQATTFLKQTDLLIITLGSAWTYRYKQTNQIVANCHKVPNKEFSKELLTVEKVVKEMGNVIEKLQSINPDIKIIFTISPVRHWKDGAEDNNLSKSILNVAVHQLEKTLAAVHYFPAYEMVIDDLRDYRFYKEDMLHPNSVAVDYVWKGVESSFFNEETLITIKEVEKIVKAIHHTAFNISSFEHQSFLKNQLKKIEEVQNKNPVLNFDSEIELIVRQMN